MADFLGAAKSKFIMSQVAILQLFGPFGIALAGRSDKKIDEFVPLSV